MKKPNGVARLGKLKELTQDANNANKGTQRGRAMLENSVRQYGVGRSVLSDKHGRIIAGNKTLEAAGFAGIEDVIIVPTDGKKLIVHQRTDLDLETDAEAKELAVVDNQANAVGLSFDGKTLVQLEKEGADLKQFFRPPEWERMVGGPAMEPIGDPIPEMEIQPFEHHDYLMVVFRDSHTWSKACDLLGVRREGVTTTKGRRKIGLGRVIAAERLFKILDEQKPVKGKRHDREGLRANLPESPALEHISAAKPAVLSNGHAVRRRK